MCTLANSYKISVYLLVVVIIISSFAPLSLIIERSKDAMLVDWSIVKYGERALYPTWELNMPEVIDYIKSKTSEYDTILSFGLFTRYIAWLVNRSVIDVSSADGLLFFARNLNYSDSATLLEALRSYNIRYILLPNEKNSLVYEYYLNYSYHAPILRIPLNSTDFVLMKEFKFWKLYKVLSQEDILWRYNVSNIRPRYPPYVIIQKHNLSFTAYFTILDDEKHYYRIEMTLPSLKVLTAQNAKDIFILMQYRLKYEGKPDGQAIPLLEFYSKDDRTYLTSFRLAYSSNLSTVQIKVPNEKLSIFNEPLTLRLTLFTESKGNYTWHVEDLIIIAP